MVAPPLVAVLDVDRAVVVVDVAFLSPKLLILVTSIVLRGMETPVRRKIFEAKMGKRTQGKQEFCELVKRFPTNDLAGKARTQVKNLGLTCGPVSPARSKKRS